jgi:ferredoxin
MRIVVDLTRCQSYGQCVFAAPTVFRFHGAEALEYDYAPDDALHTQVRWAAAACPVHAISLDGVDDRPASPDGGAASTAQFEMSGGRA